MNKPFGLKRSLLAVKDAFQNARYAGIACGVKNVGLGNGMDDIGKAALTVRQRRPRHGPNRLHRNGARACSRSTVQVASEETGLPAEVFAATDRHNGGTRHGARTTASRGTVLASAAVRDAARKLCADLDAGRTLAELAGTVYQGHWAYTETTELGADVPEPITHLTYGFATQVAILDDAGRVAKVIAAHDVGRAVNPTLVEGQIEGAVHMGLGYALTEEFPTKDGQLVNKDIKSCAPLRAAHMPEVEVIIIEEPDRDSAYGTRGVGEIGLVPTAPAVANALYKYDGQTPVRLTNEGLPLLPAPS